MWLPLNGFKVVLAQSQEVRAVAETPAHPSATSAMSRDHSASARWAPKRIRPGGQAGAPSAPPASPLAPLPPSLLLPCRQAGRHRGAHCLSGLGTCINTGACKQR